MKKMFLLAAVVVSSITATAQTESKDYLPDGVATLEWKFNPFDYESKPASMAQLTARMFLDSKNAVRLTVGIGYDKDKDETSGKLDSRQVDENNYTIANENTTTVNKETTLKLGLGYEFHFASTGRLDFYAGLEGGYLGRFYSATRETSGTHTTVSTSATATSTNVTTTYDNYEYDKSDADRTKFNENGFYGTVFTGVDFYVYKKLYIGAELGLTFNTASKKNATYTQRTGGTATTDGTLVDSWSETYSSATGSRLHLDNINKVYTRSADYVYNTTGTTTKLYIEPAIRIGWMF